MVAGRPAWSIVRHTMFVSEKRCGYLSLDLPSNEINDDPGNSSLLSRGVNVSSPRRSPGVTGWSPGATNRAGRRGEAGP